MKMNINLMLKYIRQNLSHHCECNAYKAARLLRLDKINSGILLAFQAVDLS